MWFKKLEQPGEMRQFEIHSAKFLFRKHGQQVEQELILLKFLTPVLVTRFPKGPGTWKIPSQSV